MLIKLSKISFKLSTKNGINYKFTITTRKTVCSSGWEGPVVMGLGAICSMYLEPVIWVWPVGPTRFHANPRRAGLAIMVEKLGTGPIRAGAG